MPAAPQSSPQTYYEDVAVGMSGVFTKTITEADLHSFAAASGDVNPLHLDENYARTTMFKGRIVHGMLTASLISAVFANVFPGPGAVYVTQNVKFKAPVRIGDTVTARVDVTGLVPAKKFAVFRTQCLIGDKVVVDGEATLMLPSRT